MSFFRRPLLESCKVVNIVNAGGGNGAYQIDISQSFSAGQKLTKQQGSRSTLTPRSHTSSNNTSIEQNT